MDILTVCYIIIITDCLLNIIIIDHCSSAHGVYFNIYIPQCTLSGVFRGLSSLFPLDRESEFEDLLGIE